MALVLLVIYTNPTHSYPVGMAQDLPVSEVACQSSPFYPVLHQSLSQALLCLLPELEREEGNRMEEKAWKGLVVQSTGDMSTVNLSCWV